jgi:hypothetical protein
MIMDDGRVYIMYASHQIEMMQSEGGASSSSAVDKWRGQLVYPSAAETVAAGIDALSISSPTATATPTTSALASSKAVDVAVNGRLGLVAVGTER